MAYDYRYDFVDMPETWPFEERIDEVKRRGHIHPDREVLLDPVTGVYYVMIDEATEKHHLDAVLLDERPRYGN